MRILPSLVFSFVFALTSLAAAGNTKLKVGFNWKAEPEFAGFYTAEIEKEFSKQGLDVELQEGGAGTPVIQMVSAGRLDFGTVSGDELVIARSQGQDLVAVFAVYQKAPYGIMVHASKNIKDLGELFKSGMTVSLIKGLPFAAFLEKKYGFSKVKVVPYSGGIANFIHDENFAQQCFVSSEPRLAEAQGIKVKTFLAADAGFNPYVTVVVAKGSLIKEKPELVKKFVQALRRGWEQYLKSPLKTHELISRLNPTMDMKSLNEMLPIERRFVQTPEVSRSGGIGSMTSERWQRLSEQLKELGLIKQVVPAQSLYHNF